MKFRIEILDTMIARHSQSDWDRISRFIHDGTKHGELRTEPNLMHPTTVWTGDADDDVVTVLTAAARGDNISKVIDMLEGRVDLNVTARHCPEKEI